MHIHTEWSAPGFAAYLGIPYRTLQDWELGNRKMPEYLLRLIAYRTRMDVMLGKSPCDEQQALAQEHIRQATINDCSRIAEILVFSKRKNYRSIFGDDRVSFGELQVLPLAQEYL